MTELEINTKVDRIVNMNIRSARRFLITQLEKSIIEAEGQDLKLALSLRLEDIEQKEMRLINPRYVKVPDTRYGQIKKPPTLPVNIRDTTLVLKNIQDNDKYRLFCCNIAKKHGCKDDFSDTPFGNIPKKNRVYEAIKIMYDNSNFTQVDLDLCVSQAEGEVVVNPTD